MALLDASIGALQDQGMQRVFLDAITDGVEHLKSLGTLVAYMFSF